MNTPAVERVVSHRHADRLAVAERWIVEASADGPVRIVAPTQRAADELARGAASSTSGLLGVDRATPLRLANLWATPVLAAAGRTRLTGLAAEAMAVRAIHRVTAEAPFEYFGPVAHFSGFGRAVARTVLDLRMAEIPAASLADDARARDLSRLMTAFDAEMTRLGLADTATILAAAIDAANAQPESTPSALVMIDVVADTALERRWLQKIVHRSRRALILNGANEPVATSTEGAAGLAELFDGLPPPEVVEATDDRALDRARRKIFQPTKPDQGEPDASLQFFSAPGEARECVEIARQIRDEAGRGRRFDQMAIFLPRPATYRSLIEDALRRAGIPSFSSSAARRPDPGGRALLALLACASEELSAERFAEYLSLGQVPRLDEGAEPPAAPVPWIAPKNDRQLTFASSPAPPADPDLPPESDNSPAPAGQLQTPLHWERLLVAAEVRVGGAERWRRRLEGYAAELRLQLRSLSDDQDAARAKRQSDLRSLKHLIQFSLPLVTSLQELPDSAMWADWLQALTALAHRALRVPEPVLRVLAELAPMAEVGPVSLDEVRQVLHPRLAFLFEDPTHHRFGKVFVAPIDEAAGRAFEVVFLPGLAQGVFPAQIFEDPLLLDDTRESLATGLAVAPRRKDQERRRLVWALGAATERLVASYPRIALLQGRPRVPSFYAFDLLRAAYGAYPVLSVFEREAAAVTDSQWGWPAPTEPGVALDDGEYDLAVLGPHLHAPVESVRGRGRYLVDDGHGQPLNSFLVRALSAEARRWRPTWTYADGLIATTTEGLSALAKHHPARRTYSATALQHFSQCPYRFVLQAVQRLRPREPVAPVEDLDPLTRGALFHEVQFHFLQKIQSAGRLEPEHADRARGWLDEAHTRVAADYRDRLAPPVAAVWNKAMDNMRIDLHGWLSSMLTDDDGWQPLHAELAFGLDHQDDGDRDPASVAEPVKLLDRYALRGAIDLVEVHEPSQSIRVTDHKTGRAIDRSLVHVGGGRHLQPMLYALAAQSLLGRKVESGRLTYCTRRGGYATREVVVNEDGIEAVRNVYATLEDAFDRGFFPAAPSAGSCRYCDYRRVCGPYEEQRAKLKSQDDLTALAALRSQP